MQTIRRRATPGVESIVGAVLASLLLAAGPAVAGVGGSVTPTYPAGPVRVGETFPASLTITNDSDGTNASERISVSNISHTPSCGSGIRACNLADPGVFEISAGRGAAGTACAGVTFNVSTVDVATGEVRFSPMRAWTLGPASNPGAGTICEIEFTVTVLKMPTQDSSPGRGIQTNSLAHAGFSNNAPPVAHRGLGGGPAARVLEAERASPGSRAPTPTRGTGVGSSTTTVAGTS